MSKANKADRKAADARAAQKKRDQHLVDDQHTDLDKVRRAAGISKRGWFGRRKS